jgi:hypothetical protein
MPLYATICNIKESSFLGPKKDRFGGFKVVGPDIACIYIYILLDLTVLKSNALCEATGPLKEAAVTRGTGGAFAPKPSWVAFAPK